MAIQAKPVSRESRIVEDIVGCKWSMHILSMVRRGVRRPGQMVRSTRGLRRKVLSERLNKMLRYEILSKTIYPELPPRVEYRLTPFGKRFVRVLDAIVRLAKAR